MENKDFIISKFKEVKSLEYVPSNRANNTGIGKHLKITSELSRTI